MMSTGMNNLAVEVDRIVNSPYPTQLKTLHDIVSRTSDDDIRLWAQCYTCRIALLARTLVDGLHHWPYIFNIIARLSCAVDFRDVILHADDSILERVVCKATDLQTGSKKYLDLSVALLSHRLPDDIALPESAQTLLIRLFEQAATQPEISTLIPIVHLFRGSPRKLIGVLPFSTLSRVEERLMSIMRALAPVKNKTAAIYCLSVMKTILDELTTSSQPTPIDIWGGMNSSDNSPPNTGDQWKPNALAHLFEGARGLRTLSLITLQVIWACTAGVEKTDPEATLTSVTMANDILSAVGSAEREEWCKQNGAVILRKLQERCLVPDLSPALRFQALTFLSSITEKFSLSQQHVAAYQQLLISPGSISSSVDQLTQGLQASLPRIAATLGNEWWETFIGSLLDMLLEPKGEALVHHAASMSTLLGSFTDVVEDSPDCRRSLIAALVSFKHHHQVNRFLDSSTMIPLAATGVPYCTKQVYVSLNILATSFCALLLRSALASQPQEAQLPSNLIPGLLKRHSSSIPAHIPCQSCDRKSLRRPGGALFVEVESTPEAQHSNLSWKEKLAMKMQDQAKDQQRAIIDTFGQMCRDLEERCENVEAPLRQEQDKLIELQSRHEQLDKAYGELEAQLMDRDLRINALDTENDSCHAQLENALAESRELMERVEEATQELQQANENARDLATVVEREKHESELEHATALACKQEALDETRNELQLSRRDLEALRSQLSQLEEGGRRNDAQHEKLQTEIEELDRQLQDSMERLSRAEEERKTLLDQEETLQQELDQSKSDNIDQTRLNERIKAEIEDLKVDFKHDMDKATASFQENASKAREEWLKVKTNLEQQLEETRQELVQAEDGLHEQQESNKQRTAELRKKMERLSKDCHKKDAQIAEAQEMRNRLMSAMGLAGGVPFGIGMVPAAPGTTQEPSTKSSALPYRSASTMATPKPSSQPMLSTPAPGREEPGHELEDEDSFASDASSNHGPTPKRARPRQSLGRDNLHQPRQSINSRTVKSVLRSRSSVKRQPLLDLDRNRSPAKPVRSPSKVAFKDVDKAQLGISTADKRDLEDWSFSNVDILTGTPGLALQDPMDYLDEESTADLG